MPNIGWGVKQWKTCRLRVMNLSFTTGLSDGRIIVLAGRLENTAAWMHGAKRQVWCGVVIHVNQFFRLSLWDWVWTYNRTHLHIVILGLETAVLKYLIHSYWFFTFHTFLKQFYRVSVKDYVTSLCIAADDTVEQRPTLKQLGLSVSIAL